MRMQPTHGLKAPGLATQLRSNFGSKCDTSILVSKLFAFQILNNLCRYVEDNLLDEGRQAQTLTWLKERFDLAVNVDALPLQKLRRISTVPVTLRDFENPDDLDDNARSLLHQIPPEEVEDIA